MSGDDAIAAALALPCVPVEVQPVHVQGLHIDLSFQGFLVLGFGKCNMAASGPSLWCHPGQRGPYCPTDHGKDLEGLTHFVTNNLLVPNYQTSLVAATAKLEVLVMLVELAGATVMATSTLIL